MFAGFLTATATFYLVGWAFFAYFKNTALFKGRVFTHLLSGSTALVLSLCVFLLFVWVDKGWQLFGLPSYKTKPFFDTWIPLWAGGILLIWISIVGYLGAWQDVYMIGGFVIFAMLVGAIFFAIYLTSIKQNSY